MMRVENHRAHTDLHCASHESGQQWQGKATNSRMRRKWAGVRSTMGRNGQWRGRNEGSVKSGTRVWTTRMKLVVPESYPIRYRFGHSSLTSEHERSWIESVSKRVRTMSERWANNQRRMSEGKFYNERMTNKWQKGWAMGKRSGIFYPASHHQKIQL